MIEQTQDPLTVAKDLAQHGKFDEAKVILDELAKSDDPRFAVPATFNLGWYDMREGRLFEGFKKLYVGRQIEAYGLPMINTQKPLYSGGDLTGKHILLRQEGGFGDQVINVRFAQHLKDLGAYVTVACAKDLFPLFRTLPYVDALIDNEYAIGADFDAWVPAMSVAQALKLEYADLSGAPYIPRPKAMPLAGKLKVGIRWGGNPKFEEELLRKLPAEKMCEFVNIEGVSLYSLQIGNDMIELPDNVTDLSPYMKDWMATAKMIAGLDLVITSCTSVAHVAAAMGIPTWVIIPTLPYYIWSVPGETSAWYDSIRLYRQETVGSWDEPLNKVYHDLQEMAKWQASA